ncbi:helix-turn-helix domain-containing protein [Halorussus marinus]|uniref:helix-turn-helix domain-containing protein n=1 Tax=Halorussus marinus TaxID=2505976 RepID=UPI001092D7F6|nr:helix-turn-helix domain-containing protein [Halorussus marinus]
MLATAIGSGYYQHKRETTIENIADDVGIAPTTAWEHLTRAEAKVMAELGEHVSPPVSAGSETE